ncbi:MAG: response regulator [Planctomycetaceae bacterium]|nr:response regulator [Planctomycetaceae bacterium]
MLLTETPSLTLALEKLREETFDAVLLDTDADSRDCQSLIDAIRAGSHDHQAVILLGEETDSPLATHCYESGADGFVAVQTTIPRELIWQIARAAERGQLRAENWNLRRRQQRLQSMESDEVLRLTAELESIIRLGAPITELDHHSCSADDQWLERELRELIQAHVIMGSGNLRQEMDRFLDQLHQSHLTRYSVMTKYTTVLRSVLEDLGSRSSRHVYNRGNLLLLDLILKLPSFSAVAEESSPHSVTKRDPDNNPGSKEYA